MSKHAVIVIDIQKDYFPGGLWTLSGADAAADNAARIIGAAREAGDLVVHVRHEFTSPEAPFFRPGSEGAQIHPKVLNADGEPVVLKQFVNSFRETNLKEILDSHGVDSLTVVGSIYRPPMSAVQNAAWSTAIADYLLIATLGAVLANIAVIFVRNRTWNALLLAALIAFNIFGSIVIAVNGL